MPAMMVSFDSGSTQHLNVGSSFVNRLSAFDMLISAPESFALIATEMTGDRHEHRRHRVVDACRR